MDLEKAATKIDDQR